MYQVQLRDCLSEFELKRCYMRYRVMVRLQHGQSYDEIIEAEDVSRAFVARCSRRLAVVDEGYARSLMSVKQSRAHRRSCSPSSDSF